MGGGIISTGRLRDDFEWCLGELERARAIGNIQDADAAVNVIKKLMEVG